MKMYKSKTSVIKKNSSFAALKVIRKIEHERPYTNSCSNFKNLLELLSKNSSTSSNKTKTILVKSCSRF